MPSQFSRIITLLRKERSITQKKAAEELGVSQALLSHYEKGIRECGLDFVVRAADYYGVSCDYLLGRSADRSGLTLSVDDIPAPESTAGQDGRYRGSVLPTLNRKLISNSLNVLYDKLAANPDKNLVSEVSGFIMVAVYRMFRHVYAQERPRYVPGEGGGVARLRRRGHGHRRGQRGGHFEGRGHRPWPGHEGQLGFRHDHREPLARLPAVRHQPFEPH